MKKFKLLPLTIETNPTKETNIQMTSLEEDIQQLRIRKIKGTNRLIYIYIYIYFFFIYIYKQINIMRGKKDATTFPDKPVSWIASPFRGLKYINRYIYIFFYTHIKIYIYIFYINGSIKGFSQQNVKLKSIFNAACCLYMTLQN